MGEASKVRDRVMQYMGTPETTRVLDIGCGNDKIVPWAVGVDDGSETRDTTADVKVNAERDCTLFNLATPPFDVVFSSHTLEHMKAPIVETLRMWILCVKPGGLLILYLPDENKYVYDPQNPFRRNPAHKHRLDSNTFGWYLDQLICQVPITTWHTDSHFDYSFLVVIRRDP